MSFRTFALDKVPEIGAWPAVALVLALFATVRFLLMVSLAAENAYHSSLLILESKIAYNVFFSTFSSITGPIPAKFLSAYLQPALIRGGRAQVSLPSKLEGCSSADEFI